MSGYNKMTVLGRLGADPEVRYTQGGEAVTNLSLATSERWKDKQTGEMTEKTEWHRAVLFGRDAEVAGEYLRKGSECFVEGPVETRKWQDKQGNDRYTTEIKVNPRGRLVLLGSRGDGGGADTQSNAPGTTTKSDYERQSGGGRRAAPVSEQPAPANADEDIPF